MSADEICSKCGKKLHSGRTGSLTQWLFTDDTCECDGKVASLKLPEIESASLGDESRMCEHCGKLRSDSRQGSLTQWVFGSERCACDYEKLKQANSGNVGEEASQLEEPPQQPSNFVPTIDPALIEELESGEIQYHGLREDSFPFHRYRIISEKGRGFAGIVYEAWDLILRKRVAIKTLYSQTWTPEELVRFQSEARASSKLSHRNVLQILDFGATSGGQPYMVMEFVDGTTLKELIDKEGYLGSADAVPIFIQIVEGIRHAHRNGILHRDIKSSNIMIGKDQFGNQIAKVIDFGIAALARHAQSSTSPGVAKTDSIAGSPSYMAPDQFNGLAFDVRSDIYSIGCVMFETLCGEVPFEADNVMATMVLHANAEIPELTNTYGEPLSCPDELRALIRKSLAKQPSARQKNTDELHKQLLDVLDILGLPPPVVDADDQVHRSSAEKFKTPIIVLGVLLLVGLIGLLVERKISAVPAPEAVPSTSKMQIYDEDTPAEIKTRIKSHDPFADFSDSGFILQYVAPQRRLAIDGEKPVDAVLQRAIERKVPIRELELANVVLTPQTVKLISQLNGIDNLMLIDTTGLTPEKWPDLAKCNVRELRITDLNCNVDFFKAIAQMKSLHHLELDASEIAADGLTFITHLPIDHLSLKTSKLTSAHIKEVIKFKNLDSLYVGDTSISDDDVKQFVALPKLRILGLNGLPIKDDTLVKLVKILPLHSVYIFRCEKLTKPAISRAKLLRPTCSIMDDDGDLKNSFAPM